MGRKVAGAFFTSNRTMWMIAMVMVVVVVVDYL